MGYSSQGHGDRKKGGFRCWVLGVLDRWTGWDGRGSFTTLFHAKKSNDIAYILIKRGEGGSTYGVFSGKVDSYSSCIHVLVFSRLNSVRTNRVFFSLVTR